uniref:Uncharacterized protein AlNc14C78G5164 n=1 Tax=Albugo laibachii Nc14 TaxID=890382 RepID=F0WEW6_9STRA|nr:conserved hypothetical protein [Albugo laibachii Nc14]|eukprot:CCA19748.1 conserved hypothetical protein [Albugo laibachii Nc14]
MSVEVTIQIIERAEEFYNDPELAIQYDRLGDSSAKAQQLSKSISSAALFSIQLKRLENCKIYIARLHSDSIGFLRIGTKHLYLLNSDEKYLDKDVLSLLDFYVKEAFQRRQIGLQLFRSMLEVGMTAKR